MTTLKENLHELPDLMRLAAGIGIPEIFVQRLVYFLDNDGRETGLMTPEQAVFGGKNKQKERVIAEMENLAQQHRITLRASGATDPRRSLSGANENERPWSECARPWTTTYITVNGNVLPCCISPFATTDYAKLIMGNLFRIHFSEIWNDQPYVNWRKAFLSADPPVTCAGCGVFWSL